MGLKVVGFIIKCEVFSFIDELGFLCLCGRFNRALLGLLRGPSHILHLPWHALAVNTGCGCCSRQSYR